MSTIQENLDRITNAKSAIKNAIIQKGIEVTDTEKIETYADKILQIKSGGGGGTTEIPEFDHNGPLTIYCFDDWGDAYVRFDNGYQESTIQYSTDGSTWKTYTDETIKLTKGKYVQFKGVITKYALNTHFSTFILKGGLFNLYGNLTSLDNYISTFNGGYKYNHMFENTNVYDCSMFNTGIKNIKAGNALSYMFYNCKYLVKLPELHVTTLAFNCYQYMFSGCTSLTTIPSNLLPATTLASGCYQYMFEGCTSLTTIPSNLLPATTLVNSCYSSMFNGCKSLTTIPSNLLPATTLVNSCYSTMFNGCKSLTTIPSNLLPAKTLADYCYSSMFKGCTSLTTIPSNLLPATTLASGCYQYMFEGCTSLTTIPSNLLPATTLSDYCYKYMFEGCRSLTTIPSNLLPATKVKAHCYEYMFNYCTSLTTIPKLPATTLRAYCYSNMFYGCSSLVETPDGWYLPAKTLETNSVSYMFYRCSKLQKMAVSYSGTITANHWSSFLYGVSSKGTFYYSKNQTKENIQSIVPSGWTLVQSSGW